MACEKGGPDGPPHSRLGNRFFLKEVRTDSSVLEYVVYVRLVVYVVLVAPEPSTGILAIYSDLSSPGLGMPFAPKSTVNRFVNYAEELSMDSTTDQRGGALLDTSDPEPSYTVRGTAAFIRRLASLSLEADRKLRAQCPDAFISGPEQLAPVTLTTAGVAGFTDAQGRQIVYLASNSHRGLLLSGQFDWRLTPYPEGSHRMRLTAHRRL